MIPVWLQTIAIIYHYGGLAALLQ